MGNIKVLDCTLRDGAYINDAKFGDNSIKGIADNLAMSGIEIVECGWLKNENAVGDSSYFHVPSDIKRVDIKKGNANISLMIDYNRYDFAHIKDEKDFAGVDIVRVTFPMDHIEDGISAGRNVKKMGLKLFFQLVNAKSYLGESEEIESLRRKLFKELNDIKPVCVCIADTFGSMFPEDVKIIFKLLNSNLDKEINIGIHTHNNMSLAFANTIEFINEGVKTDRDIIVDSSLLGMGRGAGNTPTELLTHYLNIYYGKKYDEDIVLSIIDKYMMEYFEKYSWGYNPYLAVAGMNESHINNTSYLREKHKITSLDLKHVLENLDGKLKPKYDYDALENIYKKVM